MRKKKIAEINVVPFIDIMLVLLIIFMITAPLMFNGIKMQLPKTKRVHQVKLDKKYVIVSINNAGEFFLGKNKVLLNELIPEIQASFKSLKSDVVYLRADFSLRYEKVARLIAFLKKGGVGQISLVTEIESK